ncbi:NADPH:quinone reductase [Microbacterium sp. ru370.1]|uniref:NADP-dependent oxidoreductase n=1 Tax=unclassified Microbacterium TaxID=2609290 RepID=UPI0008874E16|nr:MULTISPECIES: NADP-dependent oxidoreductase [unclassified Microbacterium]SDO52783.1 NADPH:quinone reductase [Microbacterium sp. ru370.1]SIT83984.1 NADPH:quinone reductase [Microbacterium sp. RU1D]
MKAMRFHEVGGPDVLRLDDVEVPTPGPGQVRIKVAASAFNAADNGMRAGFLPIPVRLPHVPGYDVSGTIDAIGPGVDGLEIGQAVVGFLAMETDGGAAEYVVAPADAVTAAPATVDLVDAAALPSVALTAWQALFDDGGIRSGQRVLIVGAGGAVGGHAVRLARRAGAHVIATASPRSLETVRAAGAHEIVDHTRFALLDVVDEPVDVLVNLAPLEPEDFAALVDLVRDDGVVVSTTAFMATPGDDRRGVDARTVFVRPDTPRLTEIVALVDAGELSVAVDRRIDLVDLPALHAEAMTGRIAGKVVVVP